jgi:hypothetical protein
VLGTTPDRWASRRATRAYRSIGITLFVWWVASLAVAHADDTTAIPRGKRIRVEAADRTDSLLVGTVVNADSDSLVLSTHPGERRIAFPAGSITALEQSLGRPRHMKRDGGIGLLIGAGVGVLFGASQAGDDFFSGGEYAVIAGVGFGIMGGAAGLLWGAFDRGEERWVPIAPPRIRVVIAPGQPRGPALVGVSVGF